MRAAILIVALLCVGCDSPTSPTRVIPNAIPQVAGTYRGNLVLTVTEAPGYDPMRGTARMTATAVQDGWTVTLTGSSAWPGRDPTIVWNAVEGTIDEDGVWTGPPRNTGVVDAECGRVDYGQRFVQLRDDRLRFRLHAETEDCGRFDWDATLLLD